jgi:two-component SAPR family response regulator
MVSGQQEPTAALRGLRILVVDHDQCMRELLCLHLANAGHTVAAAEDAVVAGRRLLSWTPDLAILDIEMPFLSGLEFAATLIADSTIPSFPIILVSAHEHFAERADSLGIHFLLRPFTKDELLRVVAHSAFARTPGFAPLAPRCSESHYRRT